MSRELDPQEKYEEEFIEYMYSNSDFHINNGDSLLYYLEDGQYFDEWFKEYHYDEWKKDHDEFMERLNKRMTKLQTQGKVYDPPMSETEQYLLNKEREEEHKSYDY
jgi:hypothetical protein